MVAYQPCLLAWRCLIAFIFLNFHEHGIADAVPNTELDELDAVDVGFQRTQVALGGLAHAFSFFYSQRLH